ncbi:MAG: hypothetical protein ACLP5H_19715 [Desulfomonilaceae bacterium]
MTIRRVALILCVGLILSLSMPPIYAQDGKQTKKPAMNGDSAKLVGVWEISQTKEPGKPYRQAYKGRPFVSKGVHAFTLILEYRDDGTFRRISRIGNDEKIQDGTWKFSGSELRHKRNGSFEEEIMYVRFDNPNQYTSTEVFEDTHDPGLFAQFKRQQ